MHGEESQVPGDLRQSEILIELDWRKIGVPSTENTRDENYLTLIPSLAITQHPSIITHNYTNFTLGFHIKKINNKN
jgi:hypothetical protein